MDSPAVTVSREGGGMIAVRSVDQVLDELETEAGPRAVVRIDDEPVLTRWTNSARLRAAIASKLQPAPGPQGPSGEG